MRAARLHDKGDLRVEDIDPPPAPSADAVLIGVAAAGICGSDLHNFRTGQWMSRKPSTPGHELAGDVLAVGKDVTRIAVGDRVVADSRFWCGACVQCRGGRPNLCENLGYVGEVCDGGFAERLLLPQRLVHRVDPALDPAVAAMAEPLAVALHAVHRLGPTSGEPVLVAGCGPIGGLAALVLSRLPGAGPVLMADNNAARLACVSAVTGARRVALERHGVQLALAGAPLRFAIDATGSVPALTSLFDTVANGATIAAVGIFHRPLEFDPNIVVERELTLAGCSAFSDELPEAIAMLTELAPALRQFIEREISLEELPVAYQRLTAGDSERLKTIVRF